MKPTFAQFVREHGEKPRSLRDYLHLLLSYRDQQPPSKPQARGRGRPSSYSHRLAIEICCGWAEALTLQSVLNEHAISRATVWRWRQQNPTCRALFSLTERYRELHKRIYPEFWDTARVTKKQILRLQREHARSPRGAGDPRRPGGRTMYRTEFDDQVQESVPATAAHLGVTERTIYNWMRRHPRFRRRQTLRSLEVQLPQIRRAVENIGVRRRHRRAFPTIEIRATSQGGAANSVPQQVR